MIDIALIIGTYLAGSLSTAIITCRLMGLPDPRSQGSGNPGATNVLRVGGKKAAAITLVGDALKGLLPVLVGQWLGVTEQTLALIAFAAFLGHLYPVFFGFKGGKGVATAFGALTGLAWPVALVLLAIWLLMAKLFHISSLAALTAAAFSPLAMWLLHPAPAFVAVSATISLMLIWRHRSNIRKLLAGTER